MKRLIVLAFAIAALAGGIWKSSIDDNQRKKDESVAERAQIAADFASWNRCFATFMALPDVAAKVDHLKKLNDSEQREFIKNGGWAAGPDGETTYNAAAFCAIEIRNQQRESSSYHPPHKTQDD